MAESSTTSDLADWQKCFSKSRQRDYYFNSKTGESLWSWEEVVEACAVKKKSSSDNPPRSKAAPPKKAVQVNNAKDAADQKQKPTMVKSQSLAPHSSSSSFKIPKIKARQDSEPHDQMSIDPEEEDEKMEIEIVENIQKFRQDTILPGEQASNWSFNQEQTVVKVKTEQNRPGLMVILDTNIFIGNLSQIKSLESTYSDKITFVVPWAVLQELDRMKMKEYVDRQLSKYDCASKSLYDIMQKAQQSIFYISRLLELNSRCFYFESAAESKKESNLIKCISNDDLILKCALVIGQSHSNSNVVLLTNDRNLCSKAIISKIIALNYKSFRSKLDDLLKNVTAAAPITTSQSFGSMGGFQPVEPQPTTSSVLKRYSPTQPDCGPKPPKRTFDQSNSMTQDAPDHMEPDQAVESAWKRFSPTQGMSSCLKPVDSISDKTLKEYLGHLACLIEKQLRTVLFDFLCLYYRTEMEKAYGDLWLDLLINRPPWTFKTLFINLKKTYKVIFTMDCAATKTRLREQLFEKLRDDITSYETFRSHGKDPMEQMRLAVKATSEAFTLIQTYEIDYFSETAQHFLKRLEFLQSNGVKLCNLNNLLDKIFYDILNPKAPSLDIPVNFQLFEPIWMQFHNFSLFAAAEMQQQQHGSESNRGHHHDFVFLFNYLICYGSMNHLSVLYEKCLMDEQTDTATAFNTHILSFVFYVLYKMLNIDVNHQDQNQNILLMTDINNELDKYGLIEANLRKCFMPENKQTMMNGFNQLNEYKTALMAVGPEKFFLI